MIVSGSPGRLMTTAPIRKRLNIHVIGLSPLTHSLTPRPPLRRRNAGDGTKVTALQLIFPFSAFTIRSTSFFAFVGDAQCPRSSFFRTVKHAIPRYSVMSLITSVTNRA